MRSNSAASIARDRLRQRPLQLIERRARLQRRDRVDQIGDRLCLRQIDPAVQERAQRELPRLGETRAARHRRGDDGAQHDRASVGAELDDVLAGVRMRGRESRSRRRDRWRRRNGPAEAGPMRGCVSARRSASPASQTSCRLQPDQCERRVARLERTRGAIRPPAMPRASGPLRRTTPMPPRPGGVAMATMVSLVENTNEAHDATAGLVAFVAIFVTR